MIAFILNRKSAVVEAGFALWMLTFSFRMGEFFRDRSAPIDPVLGYTHVICIVLVLVVQWRWRTAPKRPSSLSRNLVLTALATGLGVLSTLFIVVVPLPLPAAVVVAAAAGLAAIAYWVYRAAPDARLQDLRDPQISP